MLTYSFENIGSDSLYEHLYRCIKNDILHKKLLAGEKLPSKRGLAKNLNVSVITVENAYDQLVVEGYIYAIEKRGYFVADIERQEGFGVIEPPKQEVSKPKVQYAIDLVTNTIAHENFPFNTWAKLMREVIGSGESEKLLKAGPMGGVMELRVAISKHLYAFRGMNVEPEQIIIGAGTEYLYHMLIQLLGRKNVFAVENPGYVKLAKIYERNDVHCEHIKMDGAGISMEALERSKANIVHISPSHHYPTGIVMPVSRRYELLGWAALEEGRYIIEDDYDCEYRLSGRPIPALQSIDVMEKVIYMNTFSKSLAPSFRISYMVLPKSLLKAFYDKLGFYACTVSNFEQYALARFIGEGYFEKHINRMRNYYRMQKDQIIKQIKKSKISNLTTIHEEDAGLHFLMRIEADVKDERIIQKAKEKGVYVSCLSQYYENPDECLKHEIVVNYAGIESGKMAEAIEKLCKAIVEAIEL